LTIEARLATPLDMRYARAARVSGSVAVFGALAACAAPPPPANHTRPPPAAEPAAAVSASANAAPPAEAAAPAEPPADGCHSDVSRDTDAAPLLEQVAKSCMADMVPVAPEPLLVSLQPGTLKDLPFTVMDASKCFRAVATGAKEVKELKLQILDSNDQVLAEDKLPGSIALANPDGPICVKDPGQYRAVVHMVSGSGHVAVQVWQAE